LGITDLHISYPENRKIVADLRPESEDDWLLVAGDIGEMPEDIAWAVRTLASNFAKVVWAPGNHELWPLRRVPHCQGPCRSVLLTGSRWAPPAYQA
jgi:3',5'-cyclic AMP phosphodiesterase CpdA